MESPPKEQANIAQNSGNPLLLMMARAFVSSRMELRKMESTFRRVKNVFKIPYTMTTPKMSTSISLDFIIDDDRQSMKDNRSCDFPGPDFHSNCGANIRNIDMFAK